MILIANYEQALFLAQFSSHIDGVRQVIADDIGRIAWNSFLALIPLTLSFWLFYQPRSRVFCYSTYILLGLSFGVGIKKYNDGNFLEALKNIILSLWGISALSICLAVAAIAVLLILDRRSRQTAPRYRSLFWWIGLLPFITLLPNAPYILTDIVHFYDAVRTLDSVWAITLIIVPIYLLFIGIGWFAYVFSLLNIGKYLIECHLKRYTSIVELSLHLLCAIGIYIGRFIRFNSWSIITQPQQILRILPQELIGKFPLVVIIITFLIIIIFYTLSKPIVVRSSIYDR